ncbi:WD40 repeat domain-containing protein [Couchioplanes caeruleus]|uniref:WD40 repeat domain-containing protein n=1 Tax=Couchioplanes caeruleus TaxID=56438 RepID=UPI0014746DA9|nr:WD40 repeat domain-containing protein [Couchioplanes caeruleus]
MSDDDGLWPQMRPSDAGSTSTLGISSDGRLLFSGHSGDRLRVWDLTTRTPLAEWNEYGDAVFGVEPDTLLVHHYQALLTLDIRTGRTRSRPWPYRAGHLLPGVGGSPWYLVIRSEDDKQLVDVATGALRCTLAAPPGPLGWGVSSPDGRWLATNPAYGKDRSVRIWSTADGSLYRELPHPDSVSSVAFLPDGARCVTAGRDAIRVWDLAGGDLVTELPGSRLALAADGSLLAVADDEQVRVYATAGWEVVGVLPPHGKVWAIAFTPDGALLATGSLADSTVRGWDAATGQLAYELGGVTREMHAVAFSPDGQRLATAADDTAVRVWATGDGALMHRVTGHVGAVNAVAYSPGGGLLAVADDETVRFWDAASGASVGALPGLGAPVYALAYSPDGARLATGDHDGAIRIWDAGTWRELREWTEHRNPIWYMAFSPDGRYLVVADDEMVCAWDSSTGSFAGRLAEPVRRLDEVAVAPDGRGFALGVTARYDGRALSIYQAPATTPAQPRTGTVRALAYSPDGALAVGTDDATVQIYPDPASGKCDGWLDGHTGLVRSLAYSPDGRMLAVGCANAAVHLWDVAAERRIAVLVALDDGGSATLRSGGEHRVVDGVPNGEFWYLPLGTAAQP